MNYQIYSYQPITIFHFLEKNSDKYSWQFNGTNIFIWPQRCLSLTISSPTWAMTLSNLYNTVSILLCSLCLSCLDTCRHTWKMRTSASWRSLERFSTPVPWTAPALTHFEVFTERFVSFSVKYDFLFSSHLHEFIVTLLDIFPHVYAQESLQPQLGFWQRQTLPVKFPNFQPFSWPGRFGDRQNWL